MPEIPQNNFRKYFPDSTEIPMKIKSRIPSYEHVNTVHPQNHFETQSINAHGSAQSFHARSSRYDMAIGTTLANSPSYVMMNQKTARRDAAG